MVPILRGGAVIAVLDLDRPLPARFGAADQAGFERLAALAATRIG